VDLSNTLESMMMEFIPNLHPQNKLMKLLTIHPIHQNIIKIILKKNPFKLKRITAFLQMLIPMKERMRMTQKTQTTMQVGEKIIAAK
tara:strand:+ start:294 stop:554 length:261 start_codon:yes stop_codon:yes gene_type:complete